MRSRPPHPTRLPTWPLVLALSLLAAGQAQDAPAPVGGEAAPVTSAEGPLGLPRPRAGKVETVLRLSSEEWLRGVVKRLDLGRLTFDSDKLNERDYDWDDVLELRSSEVVEVRLADERRVHGHLTVVGDAVTIELVPPPEEGPARVEATRQDLVTVTPARRDRELDNWELRLSLSLAATFGNTQERTGNGRFQLIRDADGLRLRLDGSAYYARSSGIETVKNYTGSLQLDHDLALRTFAYVGGDVTYDKFLNLDLRLRGGAGLGFYVYRGGQRHLTLEAGPSYSYTVYRDVAPGEDRRERELKLRLASRWYLEVTEDIEFSAQVESFLGLEDVKRTTHRATATLSIELVDDLDLVLTAVYERNESPERRDDGSLPARDDLKLSTGVSYTF